MSRPFGGMNLAIAAAAMLSLPGNRYVEPEVYARHFAKRKPNVPTNKRAKVKAARKANRRRMSK